MKSSQTLSNISDKLRGTAHEAEQHLRAAAGAVQDGLRDGAAIAADGARQVSGTTVAAAESVAAEAAAIGHDTYKRLQGRTGDAIASIDAMVSRNPVGALVAALGMGLVLGFLARR
jgi:ElaB/YqjD/DUF883 family membrane-anchored ribosome-binding protein